MKRTIQASVVIILSAFFISFAYATESETFTLARNTATSWTFNLHEGSRVIGLVSIQGGTQSDLDVWVTDPVGNSVLTLGVIKKEGSIEFTANQTGAYKLHLDNGGSALADDEKIVTVSYDIESPSRLTITVGFLLAAAAVVILVVIGYYAWKKKAKRLPQI